MLHLGINHLYVQQHTSALLWSQQNYNFLRHKIVSSLGDLRLDKPKHLRDLRQGLQKKIHIYVYHLGSCEEKTKIEAYIAWITHKSGHSFYFASEYQHMHNALVQIHIWKENRADRLVASHRWQIPYLYMKLLSQFGLKKMLIDNHLSKFKMIPWNTEQPCNFQANQIIRTA